MRKVVLIVGGLLAFVMFVFAVLVFAAVQVLKAQTPVRAARHFSTKLTKELTDPPAKLPHAPPDSLYQRVEYPGPNGKLWGWMSRPPAEQKRHPAIVWIVGGFPPGGLPDDAWLEQDPRNDQSAAQYMRAGVITLYPTTRGMEGNPGTQESFLGEVADVVSAVKWLRSQPYVDPERVYVGGHSTGGTLSLLVSASTEVAGVVSMGPTDNVCRYGADELAFDPRVEQECAVRAPITYARMFPQGVIFEGGERTNSEAIRTLARYPSDNASYVVIPGADHFLYVGVMNEYFAKKIANREALTLTQAEASAIVDRTFPATLVQAEDGWSVTMPGYFAEDERENPVRRVFRTSYAVIILTLAKGSPVTCDEEGAIKGRGEECFVARPETIDGVEWVSITAQRGHGLFVTAMGRKSMQKWILAEVNGVLDTAKPAAGH